MSPPRWIENILALCAKRRPQQPVEEETPFWEEQDAKKAEQVVDEKPDPPPGFDQANHLKDEGKDKFARGDVKEAMECWVHALDALCLPPPRPEGEESAPAPLLAPPEINNDAQVKELRITLLLNLALGHKKLRQWRHALTYCDEVLLEEQENVKALYRKADALGELCEWREAEETAAKLEETTEEGKKLAQQKREEWRRRRKAADGKEKKMWSAALADAKAKPAAPVEKVETVVETPPKVPKKEVLETWTVPKVDQMSVFDLRRKGVDWEESKDFDNAVWRDGLGRRDAKFYQQHALPLTLIGASVLAEIDFQSELVVHCILDGNTAPFAQPHDWSSVLRRLPHIRSMTVVYIDIGMVGEDPSGAPPSMPYGALLRPTVEGQVGDRVARAARFLGTYKEFREHCRELPGLVVPHVALWADVPLYGFNDEDLSVRLEAFQMLSAAGVLSVFTQGAEIPEPGGPPITPRLDDSGTVSLAVISLGLRARMAASWHWNRFVVPLERGEYGILAAHALVGVMKPCKTSPSPAAVKKMLKDRGVAVAAYRLPRTASPELEAERLRRKQWEAFTQKMKQAGRPVGPNASLEERNRQAMEFYQFCGMADTVTPK
mmetsp:Transcript_147350/g.274586  ORF Transcript_147350/g.274586 Transcript_147350/m.274586 type:complete len:607 (+) Transcript_147350:199-2019(+)